MKHYSRWILTDVGKLSMSMTAFSYENDTGTQEFTDDQCAGCGGTMTMGYCDSGCDDYFEEDNNFVL